MYIPSRQLSLCRWRNQGAWKTCLVTLFQYGKVNFDPASLQDHRYEQGLETWVIRWILPSSLKDNFLVRMKSESLASSFWKILKRLEDCTAGDLDDDVRLLNKKKRIPSRWIVSKWVIKHKSTYFDESIFSCDEGIYLKYRHTAIFRPLIHR